MPLKFIVCLAAFMVASSLPAPDQVSIPDQNMKQDGETVVHSGLESYVHHPRLVRNSDTNTKSGGAGGVNYGLRVGENTVVKDGIFSTSLELPSINAMDNDIIINQNRNRIFGNSKLVVNQIDNEIFGNSEIEVNQQDNTIGGKSPILMNVDGNNIVGNSSLDVNQQRNQIGLYNKESVPALTTTTVATTTKLPVPALTPTTVATTTKLPVPALTTTTVATTTKLPVPALTTTTIATTTKLPVPALTTTTVATTTKLPASTPVLSSITAAPTTKLPVSTPELGTTTIATTTKLPGCPNGFFNLGTDECFKYFDDIERTWAEANARCAEDELYLAEPSSQVVAKLQKYMVDTYDEGYGAWLGAKTGGSKWMWQRQQTELHEDDPAWYPGNYGRTSDGHCLALKVYTYFLSIKPGKPFYSRGCHSGGYTLCQMP